MNTNGIIIRHEQNHEHFAVETLVREAFWNVYRPGCLEHWLLHVLRDAQEFLPELNFILEKDGEIIGHIAFCRGQISLDNGEKLPVLTVGPLCIAPAFQGRGYGKLLLDFALNRAKEYGGAALLEGNFAFYSKSGFDKAAAYGLRYEGMPAGEEADFFLCKELRPGYLKGISGEYGPPAVYAVSQTDADAFDRFFPPKKKQKLPGQLF